MNKDELHTFILLKHGPPAYSTEWFEQLPNEFLLQLYNRYYLLPYNTFAGIIDITMKCKIARRVAACMEVGSYTLDHIMHLLRLYYGNEYR